MTKLRVGIISANWGAMAHLPAWRALPEVEVVGICTSRQATAEAAAEKYSIGKAYWDAETMAADPAIDIVDCGTRPSIRQNMVLAALKHRKHVYNGIPFAADIDGARLLHRTWQDSGVVGVVDAFSQWLPAHCLMKEMFDADFLGVPFGGTCFFNMGMYVPPVVGFPYNWFWQKGLGVSALRNLGSHALHMLIHLFGPVAEVCAVDQQVLKEWVFDNGEVIKPETNDFASLLLRFQSGLVMQMQVCWSAAVTPGWHLEAFGSKGRFVAKAPSFPTALDTTLFAGSAGATQLQQVEIPQRLLSDTRIKIGADFPVPPSFPMALSMQRMVAAIQGNEQPAAPNFDQAWAVERILEAARIASLEKRWVSLDDII